MELNYHHLRYFWEVARDGQLTRTADRLNLSQSALSTQIKTLEHRLGHKLFDRVGRRLALTEVGRMTLDHADRIFGTGQELLATLGETSDAPRALRVGSLSTLSRNFQLGFLKPLLGSTTPLILRSGDEGALLSELRALSLDVVLSTRLPATSDPAFSATRIAEQRVALHGTPARMIHSSLQDLLRAEPVILPTDPVLRAPIQALFERNSIDPIIAAEVDDMAMVRLLAREGAGIALAPAVVVADEVAAGTLVTAPFETGISEPFYALTLPRRFPHPALAGLLSV